uniref:CNNM transmembrane domain-containing protein n=1 Tax=Panagrolaimus davidi TaxID=227884 RepID=A0A914P6A9_9BILA
MVVRSSTFLVTFLPLILSLFLRNLLATPDQTVLQTIVSGLRKGWSNETQYYIPDEILELVIFGESLDFNNIGQIFLTDAGRCGDAATLGKKMIFMIPDKSYPDTSAIIVKSEKPIPSEVDEILRLCISPTDSHYIPPQTSWIYPIPEDGRRIPLVLLLVLFAVTLFTSACLSGLNLAYSVLSLEQLHMLANKRASDPPEQKKIRQAQRVLPFRKRSNWLIATFAIGNTIVNILSTLIADEIFSNLSAKVILVNTVPVIMTMVLGEILPQAICNKRALFVASSLRIVVILMMGIFCIIAWPLSRILDCILGTEPIRVYDLKQLSILLEEHGAANKEILGAVMKFPTLKIGKIMTPIQDAYLLSQNDILDMNRMIGILEKGYTRVPVYAELDRKKIIAILNVKDLILFDPDEKKRVSEFLNDIDNKNEQQNTPSPELRFVSCEMPAQEVMNEMAHGRQHLMMVFRFDNKTYFVIGLITLEDIIEEFIGDIKDDDDAAFPTYRAGFRRDQCTFDWFRAGIDRKTNLSANGMLKLIQQILQQCPIFGKLNFNVYAMRALIHVSEIEQVEKKIVIEKGSIMK